MFWVISSNYTHAFKNVYSILPPRCRSAPRWWRSLIFSSWSDKWSVCTRSSWSDISSADTRDDLFLRLFVREKRNNSHVEQAQSWDFIATKNKYMSLIVRCLYCFRGVKSKIWTNASSPTVTMWVWSTKIQLILTILLVWVLYVCRLAMLNNGRGQPVHLSICFRFHLLLEVPIFD